MSLFFNHNQPLINTVVSNIKYGYLYNRYAAIDPLFAPTGWRLPTQAECLTLISNLGGNSVAQLALMDTNADYWYDVTAVTNSSGFYARGSGRRRNGTFSSLLNSQMIWTYSFGEGQPLTLDIDPASVSVTVKIY